MTKFTQLQDLEVTECKHCGEVNLIWEGDLCPNCYRDPTGNDIPQKIKKKCMKDCAFNVGGTCKYFVFEGIDSREMQCKNPFIELGDS